MSVESSVESNPIKQIPPSFHQFEEAHKEEITALSLIVAKITSRSIEEVKPRLDIMLSELVERGKNALV